MLTAKTVKIEDDRPTSEVISFHEVSKQLRELQLGYQSGDTACGSLNVDDSHQLHHLKFILGLVKVLAVVSHVNLQHEIHQYKSTTLCISGCKLGTNRGYIYR